jgi:hypothetical protein
VYILWLFLRDDISFWVSCFWVSRNPKTTGNQQKPGISFAILLMLQVEAAASPAFVRHSFPMHDLAWDQLKANLGYGL